jgi:hypothetical protein
MWVFAYACGKDDRFVQSAAHRTRQDFQGEDDRLQLIQATSVATGAAGVLLLVE